MWEVLLYMRNENIDEATGGIWKIEWSNNEDGPSSRLLEDESEFCEVILEEAEDDPDAKVSKVL